MESLKPDFHPDSFSQCGSRDHRSRRSLLKAAGLSGLAWLTPVSQILAQDAETLTGSQPAKSVILLWLAGGPSQLETFDPHPNAPISGGTQAIKTAVKGMQLARGFEHTADVMQDVSIIRSVVSREGDHERAFYNIKTGWRPDPTLVHPAIGGVVCHELEDTQMEIPRHVSILPNQWPARGGYLGSEYDAFRINDPQKRVPDIKPFVEESRVKQRLKHLDFLEQQFAQGNPDRLRNQVKTHQTNLGEALDLMHSDQLKAFDISECTAAEKAAYGDTPFGRGCLAAARLVQAGVRCVEVTLGGWDTHINNHESHQRRAEILDPAFAALIKDLKQRDLLDSTVVLCGGEFGRTPKINPADGRDHWPHGFSVLLAGGGLRGGQIIGATDPTGESRKPDNPIKVASIHATILHTLKVDYEKELDTFVGRPMALTDNGRLIRDLLTT